MEAVWTRFFPVPVNWGSTNVSVVHFRVNPVLTLCLAEMAIRNQIIEGKIIEILRVRGI